jgi:hypothetical protein
LDNGPAKIRTGLVIPETGMKNTQRLAIDGAEFVAEETLVVPDVLQEPLRGMQGVAFAQKGTRLLLRAPLIIKIRPENGHSIRFQAGGGRSQDRSGIHCLKFKLGGDSFVLC